MNSRFKCIKCEDDEIWDKLASESKQGNLFVKTKFLNSMIYNYECYIVEDCGVVLCGAVVVIGEDGTPLLGQFPFSQYQGILFSRSLNDACYHKSTISQLEAQNALLSTLYAKYKTLSFSFHYNYSDIRGLQWFNYHNPEEKKFDISVSYTGLIDLREVVDLQEYMQKVRSVRRSEHRKSIKQKQFTRITNDVQILLDIYEKTFKRQGMDIAENEISMIRKLAKNAIEMKFGEIRVCYIDEMTASSATLFLFDENMAYYLIGANDPEYRNTPSGVFCFLESVEAAIQRKCEYIDVCGMNSPNRADFKLSFNARPTPYFVATMQ